ncbi:hypothetical protein BS47DRAFT_672012 [Hydnum rufescens UP504]|uniref:Uncharacterized protein n=1 Tax=Hydnum rufescens UP504 TaxID=1448309 RepID=A0A9P6AEW9_9AGAM|nr:hypothetical protein BS47DRAFT_672012 [Hydnum rufescens UP504]
MPCPEKSMCLKVMLDGVHVAEWGDGRLSVVLQMKMKLGISMTFVGTLSLPFLPYLLTRSFVSHFPKSVSLPTSDGIATLKDMKDRSSESENDLEYVRINSHCTLAHAQK